MLQETKRRTAGQNMGAGKTRAGIEKRLESLTKDRQTRMGCGSQNGSKWTVGISSRCSKAHWFEAQSGTGPEKKARAVRRPRKQEWVMGAPHMKRGAEQKQEVIGIPEDHKG